jgi:hypothetical protein
MMISPRMGAERVRSCAEEYTGSRIYTEVLPFFRTHMVFAEGNALKGSHALSSLSRGDGFRICTCKISHHHPFAKALPMLS